jgi:hypothetical protein
MSYFKLISIKEFNGYLHGTLLKLVSMLSKFYFFFFLVIDLDEGVFFDFFFILTIGVIAARVIAAGAEDQIPVDIQVFSIDASGYLYIYQKLLIIFGISLLSIMLFDFYWLFYLLSVVSFTATFYFIGILRSYDPKYYELLTEIPWPLFVSISYIYELNSVNQFVMVFFGSYFSCHLLVYYKTNLGVYSKRDLSNVIATFLKGRSKIVSNILLIFLLRGLVIWSGFLGMQKDDSLAIAIAIGESFWQLCMVFVYRNYSVSCSEGAKYFRVWRTFFIFTIMLICFLIVLYLFDIMYGDNGYVSVDYVFYSVISYICIAGILDVRYHYWSRTQYTNLALLFMLSLSIIPLVLVIYFPLSLWLKLYCVSNFILMIVVYTASLFDFLYRR